MSARGRGGKSRGKLGELLLEQGVITAEQMATALERQRSMGGRLGQNLIRLSFLDEDTLIEFLSGQLKIKCFNLNKESVTPEIQRLAPLETMRRFGILPLRKEGNTLFLGMTDPTNLDAIKEMEFSLGVKVHPLALAESQWEYAMDFFQSRGWGREELTKRIDGPRASGKDYDIPTLMRELIARKGSTIHLSVGVPPTFRIYDQLVRLDFPVLTPEKIRSLLEGALPGPKMEYLATHAEMDAALSVRNIGRFRFNIYRQRGYMAAAIRYVVERIPSPEELGLPPWLMDITTRKQGLILVSAPSGHGKSTTLACLLDHINCERAVNIITLEDPIEFVHHHKQSNVNQRELGTDTASFEDGIRFIFRQDPDVISIGDMRDLDSIYTALAAADTGHLVLAALHTQNAYNTIDRIIDVFPSQQQNQVRNQLADTLLLIFSQRLVPRADGSGRVLAFEKLQNSFRIQNLIREKKAHLIKGQTTGVIDDFSSLEHNLALLFKRGTIAFEEGRKYAEDTKLFELLARQ